MNALLVTGSQISCMLIGGVLGYTAGISAAHAWLLIVASGLAGARWAPGVGVAADREARNRLAVRVGGLWTLILAGLFAISSTHPVGVRMGLAVVVGAGGGFGWLVLTLCGLDIRR